MKQRALALTSSVLLAACSEPAAVGTTVQHTSEPETAVVEEVMVKTDVPVKVAAFKKELELQGVYFSVEASNGGSTNTLTITPSGLAIVNDVICREIEGTVSNAEVADINADGSPEIYIWANSTAVGSSATVIGYSANNKKSLTEIYFPPISDDPINNKGYKGLDEFAVLEGVVALRFPIYAEGDNNPQPTGKTRQIQYKLTQGEAGWVMKLDSVSEF